MPLQGTLPGWFTSRWGLVRFTHCRFTDCCLQHLASGMRVPGTPQLPPEHIWDTFFPALCPTGMWLSPQVRDNRREEQMAERTMRAPFLLAPQHTSHFHPCWGHQHAFLSPPRDEMLRGSPACGHPACSWSRSALGQHSHALQHGLGRPAAKGRKSALVKHHIWSGATSTKHRDVSFSGRCCPWEGAEVWDEFSWTLTEDAADFTWFHNESLELEKGNSPGKSKGVIKRT